MMTITDRDPGDENQPAAPTAQAEGIVSDIDHEFTEYGVCPWCGHEHVDCWELFRNPTIEDDETTCDACDKPFLISVHTSVTYSTRKIEPKDPSR